MLEVCVVGFGALGALYSFLIEKSKKAAVTAVCRSNYGTVKSRGIDIRSEAYGDHDAWKPSRVVSSTLEAADRKYDCVICATKYIPDVLPTTTILGPLLTGSLTFVLIQNGIGIHEELRSMVPDAVTVISACAWVDATILDEGRVLRHGRDRLILGAHMAKANLTEDVVSPDFQRTKNLVAILQEGGCDAVYTENIAEAKWQKNLWNISYSVYCTLSRASVATALTKKWEAITTRTTFGFMEEAVVIARAIGLDIPDSAIQYAKESSFKEYAESVAERADPPFTPVHFKPSMLVDLEAGRPMEIEGILGGVLKEGRKAGVVSPRLETAYALLLLLQEPLLEKARRKHSSL
ncbi:6-phosphogluconate dehydrogenase C-terminal domain-like protein [Hysterangium stoloniferum]|nr:6-phosphogluconate dehydrogenase C-terminal domain-like protein [Hysterangium stoloniferum]